MLPTVECPNWPTILERKNLDEYARKYGIELDDDGGAYTSPEEDNDVAPKLFIRPCPVLATINEEEEKKDHKHCFCKQVKADLENLFRLKNVFEAFNMPFCPSQGCPLNAVTITPETTAFELIVSFFASTHQPDVIFTPSQLGEIYNEILFMVKKYQDAKSLSESVMIESDLASNEIRNIKLNYSREGDITERESNHQLNSNTNTTASKFSVEVNSNYHDCRNVSMTSPNLSDDGMALMIAEEPQSSESPVQSITPNFAAPYSSSSSIATDSPYLYISFKDIYRKTGFIGLKKIESLDKLSRCVSKPLGCCYDEVREIWAIADSANNRVVLYPEGITIESPKFKNPGTVCVVEPGKTLGILSDCCLATYSYDDQNVSIVKEGNKLQCRGLVRTPLGHMATIHRVGASRDLVLYDMINGGYGKPHSVINISVDPNANPSFCAMNGNRIVITDLGRQTLTLVVLSPDETKAAEIHKTEPLHWTDKQNEPNGRFEFVSGVQMDRNGWIIVADAGGHTLQLFDENLKFITRVGSNFPLPYMSSISINNNGKVVIVGRRDNDLTLSELVSCDSLSALQKHSHGGMRGGGGANGGRGRGGSVTSTRGGNGGYGYRGGHASNSSERQPSTFGQSNTSFGQSSNSSFGQSNYGYSGGSRFN